MPRSYKPSTLSIRKEMLVGEPAWGSFFYNRLVAQVEQGKDKPLIWVSIPIQVSCRY